MIKVDVCGHLAGFCPESGALCDDLQPQLLLPSLGILQGATWVDIIEACYAHQSWLLLRREHGQESTESPQRQRRTLHAGASLESDIICTWRAIGGPHRYHPAQRRPVMDLELYSSENELEIEDWLP